MAIREVLTAPRPPWQSPYVERLIGSIRRECLDHTIVFNESSLQRTLKKTALIKNLAEGDDLTGFSAEAVSR